MILPAQWIRIYCTDDRRMVEPFCERSVFEGMSYGLSAASYDIRIAENLTLYAGAFALASTMEYFRIPKDIVAFVHDKSSWARRGVATQNTLFDPGWCGYATLELSNHSNQPIYIKKGSPIAQIAFHLLTEFTYQPYQGKYQNQEAGPQEARLET